MMRLIYCLLLACLVGCSKPPQPAPSTAAASPRPVQLQLNWFPESEHGGYFQALLGGHFAAHGLEVEILEGGPSTPVEVQVGAGRIQFGIVNADKILVTRAQGVPIVGLLAPFQTSPRCLIVHADSPYKQFEDIRDTTLVGNASKPFIAFLRHRFGLEGVQIIPYKGGLATFLANHDHVIQGYVTSEPLAIERQGVASRSLLVADAGFNPYTSVLVTNETLLREQPDLVADMVQAACAGWAEYLADPGPANAEIRRLNPEIDAETLAFGAQQLAGLMLAGDAATAGFGAMTEARWQLLADQLVACAVLDQAPAVKAAYTTRFLPASGSPE